MTAGLKPTVANSLLDALLRATSYAGPATIYMKLHVGDPGSAGTANPAAETTRKAATFGAASGGVASNTGALTWTSVAGSEDFTHFSLWDAASSGNFLGSGTIVANAVTVGDTFTIDVGAATVTFTVAA